MQIFSIEELDQKEESEVKSEVTSFANTPSVKTEELTLKEELKALGFPRGYYSDKLFKMTKQLHQDLREFIEIKKQKA